MFPLLHDGDVLYLKKIKYTHIQVNDIVCVRKKVSPHGRDETFFTHRVIYKTAKYLITRGDNNYVSDGKIYPTNIVGVVSKAKRKQVFNVDEIYLFQSTFYFEEIIRVKRAFEKHKVDFVFLKGLPLHLYYVGSHPQRLYADCDILISKRHTRKVVNILQELGFKRSRVPLSLLQEKLKNKDSEVTYYKTINGIPVMLDIHFEAVFMMTQLGKLDALYPQRLVDSLGIFFLRNKRLVIIHEEKFPILSHANLIIYLFLHLFHHNFKGTFRYDFIRVILEKENYDDQQVIRTIKEYKLENFILPCILLLERYYKNQHITKTLGIKPDRRMISMVQKINIFDENDRVGEGIERFKYLFLLSPMPLYKKITVFLNPEVIVALSWVLRNKSNFKKLFAFPLTHP